MKNIYETTREGLPRFFSLTSLIHDASRTRVHAYLLEDILASFLFLV
jgi:hypothetical protein